MIVLSPYAVVHGISYERAEHSSIIKLIDDLFSLTPLADLPDEAAARQLGEKKFGQPNLGPADDKVPGVGDLFSAFDNARLTGKAEVLPAEYAMIPASQVTSVARVAACCRFHPATLPCPIRSPQIQSAPGHQPGNPRLSPVLWRERLA